VGDFVKSLRVKGKKVFIGASLQMEIDNAVDKSLRDNLDENGIKIRLSLFYHIYNTLIIILINDIFLVNICESTSHLI
jgi:hypothetical protein